MLKVIIAIVTSLLVMIAAVWVVGSRLPVSHVASRSVIINAPIDSVYSAMTGFASSTGWRSGVKSIRVDRDSAGRTQVVEESNQGTMTLVMEESIPPTRFVMRLADQGLPFGGAWAHALEPQGNTTRVTITEHGEVYDPMFRFIGKYLMGHAGTIETYLTDLGRRFGTDVTLHDATPVPVK